MSKLSLIFILVLSLSFSFLTAQTPEERAKIISNYNLPLLNKLEQQYAKEFKADHEEALRLAALKGWEEVIKLPDGGIAILVGVLEDGSPKYYETHNRGAGITTRTNLVQTGGSSGLDLNGENMIGGVWDGGRTRASHVLLQNRVTQIDNPYQLNDHATHVSGTMIGTGDVANGAAKGMAPEAELLAHDFLNDEAEMTAAAADGLLISNHSYGLKIEQLPLWYLGYYDQNARNLDNIAYNAPYYLPVVSAGNDRQSGQNPGDYGYDYLTDKGVSKNSIVSAAVFEVLNYTGPSNVIMSNFSSWGPTDDGRIKPDLSAKGVNTYSSTAFSNHSYAYFSGTSMSAPNTSGSLLLLQQHYNNVNSSYMLSSTLRGLVLHTADEAGGTPGPDYRFGWGLMNTARAADVITNNGVTSLILEEELAQDEVYTFSVKADDLNTLMVSITWTDPAGTTPGGGINDLRTPMLVNDLDLRISDDGGNTFYPWMLNPDVPSSGATTGDNIVDNIEKVEVANASGEYIIRVSHKGELRNGSQVFSLIATGIDRESFAVSSHQGYQEFCPGADTTTYDIDLAFGEGFTDTINFSVSDLPNGVNATITPNTLSAEGTVVLTVNGFQNLAPGDYQIKVTATGTNETVNVYPILHINNPQLDGVDLLSPADDAIDQPLVMTFDWEDAGMDAENYDFQLATDANFGTIFTETTTTETSVTIRNLTRGTEYFWHVRAKNTCGDGDYSEVFSFTTEEIVGISENSIDGLVVYPNPTSSVLTIQANDVLDTVEILNVLGQSLMTKTFRGNNIQLNTNSLRAGNYFVKITSENKVTIKRIVKI
ncbi:T9SS type A sorting domain-containing protein [Aequorivita sp. H23M31]|uniref:T9SS type A sorting domain-containing protein n=1 Tax=Aequorivita ciconiae TaxID=2494375 RepID=A0A410G2I5_9FLAO|nr:S8 family serine peptidase [Aequorivita sp. H23M31]QAA81463.1 T9SS type A sorting domain-containing protein [Aequorivita sp. H23M31]